MDIRVGGVGGLCHAPLGREGSAFGSSSHLHESCWGQGWGRGHRGAPVHGTSANTHTLSVDYNYTVTHMEKVKGK